MLLHLKSQLHDRGFIVLRDQFPLSLIRKLEAEILHICWTLGPSEDVHFTVDEQSCNLSSAHNLIKFSDQYLRIFNDQKWKDIYYQLTGIPASNLEINSSFFFKHRTSLGIKPHQDNAYFNLINPKNCLTFYIPTSEQSRMRGGIYYIPESNNLGIFSHVPEGNLGTSMCLDRASTSSLKKLKVEYPKLGPGDIAIHNGQIVHGTISNPKNLNVSAFNFTIVGSGNEINSQNRGKYLMQLRNFKLQRTFGIQR